MFLRRGFAVPNGFIFCVFVITFLSSADARAVNISNTWILPEEGFPVFYRYFRDRISWYEADAVCQFHHANLITVDSTAQYDAARAYLKELDIMSDVWIGLIKSNEEGGFSWTDYKPLSGEGYWASSPEEGRTPLCTALDPAKDYRWSALSCGGPQVASFICELQVPTWALKPDGGCLVKSLPSLTVQFLPELAAVQLISDCGLDGTKKVTCKSNESHPDVLKELSCPISEDDFTDNQVTVQDTSNSGSSNLPHTDTPAFTTTSPGDYSTRMRRETIPTSPPITITTQTNPAKISLKTQQKPLLAIPVEVVLSQYKTTRRPQLPQTTLKRQEVPVQIKSSTPHSEITDESLVSENPTKPSITTTSVPVIVSTTTAKTHEIPKVEPIDADKKLLIIPYAGLEQKTKPKEHHDNIYTAPTDHFIPPLVMAKSKVNADLTVVSPEEKHLQQMNKHNINEPVVEQAPNTKKQGILLSTKTIETTTEIPVTSTVLPEQTTMKKMVSPKSKPLIVIPPTITTTSSPPIIIQETTLTTTVATPHTTLQSQTTPVSGTEANVQENTIDSSAETKIRKPSKGKKYDKNKEEKKKYRDISTQNKSPDTTNKVVSVSLPNVGIKTTPITIIEITTKATESPTITTTLAQIKDNKTTMTSITMQTTPGKQTPKINTENNATANNTKNVLIDPNLMILNKEENTKINNESEIVNHNNTSKPNDALKPPHDETVNKDKKEISINIPTVTVNKATENEATPIDKIETTPDPLPRPNRSRTLIQTAQHRSFYPYFFNRVLG